jgi:hypothetical protein
MLKLHLPHKLLLKDIGGLLEGSMQAACESCLVTTLPSRAARQVHANDQSWTVGLTPAKTCLDPTWLAGTILLSLDLLSATIAAQH